MELRRAGRVLSLEPKAFDVLRHLMENRDRLVTKDELLDVVWKDTFVTPNVLTRVVAMLRKALGDDAFEARYIETVAKRGYRFIAPVRVTGPEAHAAAANELPPPSTVPVAPRRRPRRRWVVAAAAVAMTAAALTATHWFTPRRGPANEGDTTTLTPRRLTAARDSYGNPAISP